MFTKDVYRVPKDGPTNQNEYSSFYHNKNETDDVTPVFPVYLYLVSPIRSNTTLLFVGVVGSCQMKKCTGFSSPPSRVTSVNPPVRPPRG